MRAGNTEKYCVCVSARVHTKAHICAFSLCAYTPAYECAHVCGRKRDGVQLLPLSPSLNGLLMESNEGVLSWQMSLSATLFYPETVKLTQARHQQASSRSLL